MNANLAWARRIAKAEGKPFLLARKPRTGSSLEETFLLQIRAVGLPEPAREERLIPGRQWRWDFSWRDAMVCVELQGGTWIGGAHSRGAGQTRDAQKSNAVVLAGWAPFVFTGDMVRSGEAVQTLTAALR